MRLKQNIFLTIILIVVSSTISYAQTNRITSSIEELPANELVLKHEFTIDAPLAEVWTAYTTGAGWEAWAVAHASVDLKTNGKILTNYNPNGEIGDDQTLQINILNYIPYRLITLQSVIPENFPSFLKENETGFYNIIEFIELEDSKTRVISYGLGYTNSPEFITVLNFFSEANEEAFNALIDYLEN